jgi:SH3-like domain-containing protein
MGTTVVVLKQYRTWDWVQFPDGSFGWVAGAAIGTGNAAPVANSLSAEPLPLTTPTIDGLRVHVRPNLAAPVVASAFHGQKALVLKRWLGWLRILLPDGTRGWVDGALIASAAAQQDETAHAGSEPAPTSTHPTGPTITATVRVHARPGLQAPVLRLAVAGTHVQVLGSRGQWVRALLPDGESGWISSAYVHLLCPLCGRGVR